MLREASTRRRGANRDGTPGRCTASPLRPAATTPGNGGATRHRAAPTPRRVRVSRAGAPPRAGRRGPPPVRTPRGGRARGGARRPAASSPPRTRRTRAGERRTRTASRGATTRRRADHGPPRAGSGPMVRTWLPAGHNPPPARAFRVVLSMRTASRAGPAALTPRQVRVFRAGVPAVRSQLRPAAGSPTSPDTVRALRPEACRAIRTRERFLRRPTPSRRRGRTSPPVPTRRPGRATRGRNVPPHHPAERRRRAPSRRTR